MEANDRGSPGMCQGLFPQQATLFQLNAKEISHTVTSMYLKELKQAYQGFQPLLNYVPFI